MLIVIGWSIDFYGEIRPEQFIYNITSNSQGTNYNVMKNILHTPLLIVSCLSILFFLFLFMKIPPIKIKNKQKKFHWNYLRTITLSLISLSVLFLGVNYAVKTEYLDATYNAFLKDSDYIERNYVKPSKIELKFPEKKRNLIHIYAESFENSYTSKELGGNMDENLIPNLTELTETSGFNFSHNDVIGGWNQTYGSSWSIAGIVNMETGLPLKLAIDGNSYGKEGKFLPGVTNLGDILNTASYNQTVLMGSDAKFAGRDVYFKEHGNYSIFDVNEAKRQNLIPEDYNEWWGFEDDKLFEFAKDELTRLNNLDQPFHLNMITADTHFPDGYVSKNITRTRTSQYADVIAYSDEQIGQFIRWIKEQPFYENTTIVITGDHLSMDKTFFQDFSSEYKRTPFNIFINAPFSKEEIQTKNREFAAFDMFPTIVASLGIEIPHNKMGLGTNLFSREKTEIELNTINAVNEELEKYSKYYDTEFLNK
ncbi:MAG: LTA synthase family protein [Culicoidibacterales bacterium]